METGGIEDERLVVPEDQWFRRTQSEDVCVGCERKRSDIEGTS